MTATHLKGQAHALIDQLAETATWDDVLYEMAVRREIEEGLKDSAAARVSARIHDHVAKDARAAASALVAKLVRRSRQIAQLSRAGRMVPGAAAHRSARGPGTSVSDHLPHGSDRIDILTILHYRQLLPDDLS
jgi:plasmid stabilization system protein ParE